MIFEYTFDYETYGVIIIEDESKQEAFNMIQELAKEHHTIPDVVDINNLNEINSDENGGILFYKSGEYEE